MIGGSAHLVGLIGWPIEHSVSPAMHNAAFEALGLDWRYSLLPTPPGSVEARLADLKVREFKGANVTVPHKQAVMPYLDDIDEAALAIGAVNTILVRGDRLIGCNTDAGGFLSALRDAGYDPSGKRALVLGAGGAARAVVYALVQTGAPVILHNRTASRAEKLARSMLEIDPQASVTWVADGASLADLPLTSFDLLINTTPVGMWPQIDACPWPETLPMPGRWTVNDLVYNPAQTRLLARARAAGAAVIGGLGMLVHQGVLAFELWTGQAPPADVMRVAAERTLAQASPEAAGTED